MGGFTNWRDILKTGEDFKLIGDINLLSVLGLVRTLMTVAFAGLPVLLVGVVGYGGFVWVTAGDNEERLQKAKKIMRNAIIGILIPFIFLIVLALGASIMGINITNFTFLDSLITGEDTSSSGDSDGSSSGGTTDTPRVIEPTPGEKQGRCSADYAVNATATGKVLFTEGSCDVSTNGDLYMCTSQSQCTEIIIKTAVESAIDKEIDDYISSLGVQITITSKNINLTLSNIKFTEDSSCTNDHIGGIGTTLGDRCKDQIL